jgi:hypothetical protein
LEQEQEEKEKEKGEGKDLWLDAKDHREKRREERDFCVGERKVGKRGGVA